ncbi:MAG: 1-phosphofructokinase [Phormidesmis sp.]
MQLMKRIATVTLNPAVDQTVAISNFQLDAVNRVIWERSDAGGKGINVAAFLADYFFDIDASHHEIGAISATGLMGLANAEVFETLFSQKGIDDHFVRLPGKNRVNIKIVDESQAQLTDINFPGITASDRDLQALEKAIATLAKDHDWFIFSGSLPPGLPADAYYRLMKPLKDQEKQIVLDTSGDSLKDALGVRPNVIKPNLAELRTLLNAPLIEETDIAEAALQLIDFGVETVVVSMGSQGALFVDSDTAFHVQASADDIKSTVGAGDAMVAGIVAGLSQARSLAACAKLATAFSVGTLGQMGAHLPSHSELENCCDRVSIRCF